MEGHCDAMSETPVDPGRGNGGPGDMLENTKYAVLVKPVMLSLLLNIITWGMTPNDVTLNLLTGFLPLLCFG